jgi:putative addiction module killer protein
MKSLHNPLARQIVQNRIARLQFGNLGKTRSVGSGVHELKIDYGPGYRVYFALDGAVCVILRCGGDKSSQDEDIKTAKAYWADLKARDRGLNLGL